MTRINKTRAGIDWVYDPFGGPAKILVGDYAVKRGRADGLFTKFMWSHYEQLVGDRMPEAHEYLKRTNTGSLGLGRLLAGRAAFCLPNTVHRHGKDELRRFQRPCWSATYDAVTKTQDRLTLCDLQELQAQRIILTVGEGPAYYHRGDLERPEDIYVGSTDDLAVRDKGHINASHYLCYARGFPTKRWAETAEKMVADYLLEVGALKIKRGTRSLYRLRGQNAMQVVEAFISSGWARRVFHNTVDLREKP